MSMRRGKILMVDDEEDLLLLSKRILEREGHIVVTTTSAHGALRMLEQQRYDIVFLDLRLPDMDGVAFLEAYQSYPRRAEVVVLTAFATVDTAVKTMRLGAYGYIAKPFNADEVLAEIDKVLELRDLRFEIEELRQLHGSMEAIIGRHAKIQSVRRLIDDIAPTNIPVLIRGETGTGKELVARAIHGASDRADKPMLSCNCAAFAPGLLESELFGHVRGAFTGAIRDRTGRFEEADGGTLFLDEIGDLETETQIRLLRVLQEQEFQPVGATETRKVDVRIITATNRDLEQEITDGHFRADLYYRVNAVTVEVPPLRQRKSDLQLLCAHFIGRYKTSLKKEAITGWTAAAMRRLESHSWPGNVRELENVLMRAVAVCGDREVDVDHLEIQGAQPGAPHEESSHNTAISFQEARRQFELAFFEEALRRTGGNIKRAAEQTQVDRTQLHRKIKEHSIDIEELYLPVDSDEE